MILLLRSLMFPLLLGAGLLAPGWLLGRALRTPAGLVGAFLGSAALLLNLLLALDALDLALTGAHVALGLAAVCALLALIAKLRGVPPSATRASAWRGFRWQPHHWLLLPATLGLGAIALRASLEPLSGFDTIFRWDFLAQQMLRDGSLHFYPPVSADDFLHYGWCDGIAPLVSSLYFWSYLGCGKIVAWATAPVVIGQAALLFLVVYQLATRRAGAAAGCAAAAVLATSCVLLWGVAMGQETGLTALSLVAMFLFIERQREDPAAHWLVWAGVAAGTGALAREYGLAFIALGGLVLAWHRVPRRGWLDFTVAAALVALPWFARNWIRTGNPLYSFTLGGLFPANPISVEYFHVVGGLRGLGTEASPWSDVATLLVRLAGVPLVLALAGVVALGRKSGPWLGAIAGVAALWLWSVGQTSGGPVYALRVLTPALALGAVFGGIGLARWLGARSGWLVVAALTLAAVDAGERSLFMPIDPRVLWWSVRANAWRDFRTTADAWNRQPAWAALADAADGRQILVSDPFAHALLAQLGAKPVPIFSPAVRFLFAADADFAACRARLRANGVRFILIFRPNSINEAQASLHPFFRALLASPPTTVMALGSVYDLYSAEPAATMPDGRSARPPHAP